MARCRCLRHTDRLDVRRAAYEARPVLDFEALAAWLRRCPRAPRLDGKPLATRRDGFGTGGSELLGGKASSLPRSSTALGAAFRQLARHDGGAVGGFAIAWGCATPHRVQQRPPARRACDVRAHGSRGVLAETHHQVGEG
jgi:hypothetical protein